MTINFPTLIQSKMSLNVCTELLAGKYQSKVIWLWLSFRRGDRVNKIQQMIISKK